VAILDIPYELIAPDGTRAVVGNSSAAQQDPDWIGMLDPESNIQGLLDTATVRGAAQDLVEADGQSMPPLWLGGRSGTIQGTILPSSLDLAAIELAGSKFKRATRALRADGILRWTPPQDSSPRQLRVRRQDGPRDTGRRPKGFQVTLQSPDPYALSSSESSLTITPGAVAGELGVQNPETDPETSALNVAGQQFVVNAGDAPTWPRFRIDGPIVNPVIVNSTTGQAITLVYNLGGGEWLDVYPERGLVLLGGTAARYSAVLFDQTSWWQLAPGSNDVRLLAFSYTAPPALLTVYWRSAWE
jgi:hypothetical protein